MPLASYWVFFVGVALAALVLLAIYTMLAMAHLQDEDQDRLEIELRQGSNFGFSSDHEGNLEKIQVSIDPDLKEGGAAETRILLN